MEQVLRTQPHLVYYNYANISDRLLEATNNDLFVAYNKKRSKYEMHSIRKFRTNKHARSVIGSYIKQKFLNGWLVTDVGARDLRRFYKEMKDNEDYIDLIMSEHEENMSGIFIETGLKEVRKMLGGT